jgi:hypothetical protein
MGKMGRGIGAGLTNGFEEEDADTYEEMSDLGHGFCGFLGLASGMVERNERLKENVKFKK